jgi:serine/threonine protein kinase/formylglycine-generating enzyme required for sulfatase activity
MGEEESNKDNTSHSEEREPFFTGFHTEPVKGPGSKIGQFHIESELGRGGAGVVYLAQDTRLDRQVALKSISSALLSDPAALPRFRREAKVLASLNHPNIAAIYDEIEDDNRVYLVLEYVPGETLQKRIERSELSLREVLAIAVSIADAMCSAHHKGIIHRDLKPNNVRITPEGSPKVLDFGIAKIAGNCHSNEPSMTFTEPGLIIGTPGYMSPEQVRGEPIDHRTDIWAFGCVFYEMLTGKCPFSGATTSDALASVLTVEPDLEVPSLQADPELVNIVTRCLKKDSEERYQSASDLCHDLRNYQHALLTPSPKAIDLGSLVRLFRKPKIAGLTGFVMICLCVAVFFFLDRRADIRYARFEAIPEIMKLIEQEAYFAAFSLALDIERYIPNDPILQELWPQMSQSYSVTTDPPGAQVFFREYSDAQGDWLSLGTSPIKDARMAPGYYAWRITKDGHETMEAGRLVNRSTWTGGGDFHLREKSSIPSDMVFIPDSNTTMAMVGFHTRQTIALDAFLIDRFEVTNREYKDFVDNGGYTKREYWEHDFVKDGHVLTWDEAMGEFHDMTGWSGPLQWRDGHYPQGQPDCPVGGISWYEAAAYAKYIGKELPTAYHWCRAAMATLTAPSVAPMSNFGSEGPSRAGAMQGLGFYGTYDMAGNVREWCYNPADDARSARYILGGAWGEASYMYSIPASRAGFDRYLKNGFRCMKYLDQYRIPEERLKFLKAPKNLEQRDLKDVKVISDDKFDLIRASQFEYDKHIPLDVEIQTFPDVSDKWRKEKVTINAAYNGERMDVYVFTPKNKDIVPPYQAVIGFPGLSSLQVRSSEGRLPDEYIIESGRAMVLPNYRGMFERGPLPYEISFSGLPIFEWVKDWLRTADYLETREDIDANRLAYVGGSLGGFMGCYLSGAQEPRFKAAVLVLAGIPIWEDFINPPPEYDPVNYLPRITMPVLMINGLYDSTFPVETSQRPMFELLGTPAPDKYHVIVSDGQHGGWDPQKTNKRTLEFLDKYLGRPLNE